MRRAGSFFFFFGCLPRIASCCCCSFSWQTHSSAMKPVPLSLPKKNGDGHSAAADGPERTPDAGTRICCQVQQCSSSPQQLRVPSRRTTSRPRQRMNAVLSGTRSSFRTASDRQPHLLRPLPHAHSLALPTPSTAATPHTTRHVRAPANLFLSFFFFLSFPSLNAMQAQMVLAQAMGQYSMLEFANSVLEQCWDICYDRNMPRADLVDSGLSDAAFQKSDACARKCIARNFEVMKLMQEAREQRARDMAGMGGPAA